MPLPARIGLITLACRDVERMARFFRDLGWPETPASDEHHRTFQCTNGCVIGLYAATHYEPHFGPVTQGAFRGIVLSVNGAAASSSPSPLTIRARGRRIRAPGTQANKGGKLEK